MSNTQQTESNNQEVVIVEEVKQETETEIKTKIETETKIKEDVDIEQSLTCGVCQDILYNSKTLICQHTFCSSCLVSQKNCPICRLKINEQPRINTIFNDIVEILYDDKKIQELKNKNYEKELLPKVIDELKKDLNNTFGGKTDISIENNSTDTYVMGYNLTSILKYIEMAFLIYYIYSFIRNMIYDFNMMKCLINGAIITQSLYSLFYDTITIQSLLS
jgi:hypothetical protein